MKYVTMSSKLKSPKSEAKLFIENKIYKRQTDLVEHFIRDPIANTCNVALQRFTNEKIKIN
jgi:hypothetical protein